MLNAYWRRCEDDLLNSPKGLETDGMLNAYWRRCEDDLRESWNQKSLAQCSTPIGDDARMTIKCENTPLYRVMLNAYWRRCEDDSVRQHVAVRACLDAQRLLATMRG